MAFAKLHAVYQTYEIHIPHEELARFVTVDTWDEEGQAFEFAHFSCEEITDAIFRMYPTEVALPRLDLLKRIAIYRREKRNLEKLSGEEKWWNSRGVRKISKTTLAEELWPILEKKLTTGLRNGTVDEIPVCRILHRAFETAFSLPRQAVAIHLGSAERT